MISEEDTFNVNYSKIGNLLMNDITGSTHTSAILYIYNIHKYKCLELSCLPEMRKFVKFHKIVLEVSFTFNNAIYAEKLETQREP